MIRLREESSARESCSNSDFECELVRLDRTRDADTGSTSL